LYHHLYFDQLFSLIALLICAEDSFWHPKSNFLDAFSDSLQFYQSSGTQKAAEDRLSQLGMHPENTKCKASVLQYFQTKSQDIRQEEYKTALGDLILAHCLGISTLFYVFFISYH